MGGCLAGDDGLAADFYFWTDFGLFAGSDQDVSHVSTKPRCSWVPEDKPDYARYHDTEWGRPVHDDRKLFEMLILEGAQAGLSWYTILRRRDGYRKAFKNFEPDKVAKLSDAELKKILATGDIIRNRLKVFSARKNALVFLAIQKEFGSFDAYVWQFVGGKPKVNRPRSMKDLQAHSTESDALSKDLKKRGMNFVGSTIVYAFMQAVGLVNDHMRGCYLCPQ
jgi:DNA-3-methyladenine glycosylase I